MHRNPETVRFHPDSGVPLMANSERVANHHPALLQKQYELLTENLRRCRAQQHQPREVYRSTASGHKRIH